MLPPDLKQARGLYNAARKWFAIASFCTGPVLLVINAPFGRFALKDNNPFMLDGIKSWMVMEIVSPACFLYALLKSPLSPSGAPASFTEPHMLLAALYLIHYANRAVISPLRTPSRSKSHLIVALAGVGFNIFNGSLMGSYLSSPAARANLTGAYTRPLFYLGIALWAVGFAGNIAHDEILLNIRRKAQDKKRTESEGEKKQEHYAIPQGLLYKYISYPNYFCEWVEWTGFALAAAPVPVVSLSALTMASVIHALVKPATTFWPSLTPPYIFLLNEVVLMLPRAIRGHNWYHDKFGDRYPKERKAVVPFLL
ncbi:3-oxo-5-alpha-steroid 4-dehydrogenase-domain-containing protein [Schizophyllum amplum]|uniref:3-oxo-5-alpha-steroid 4-dehydrogenase-domain-containing protein n=1 Tax=Schizophyllum amplum TaxID=97359 RepID=A0A550C6Z3_9AGAR|nr:3-oxo-5-alpha-steroid 4-dehydrogenase-domain-containing protein [Auriculariopsis ampla]